MPSSENLVEAGQARVLRHPRLGLLRWLRFLLGCGAAAFLLIAGISDVVNTMSILLGLYLIVIFVPVLLLEASAILRTLCGTDGICCRFFSVILSFDSIMRAILYILFSIPCFLTVLSPTTLTTIAGILLDILAALYVIKMCEYKKVKTYISTAPPPPPPHETESA